MKKWKSFIAYNTNRINDNNERLSADVLSEYILIQRDWRYVWWMEDAMV